MPAGSDSSTIADRLAEIDTTSLIDAGPRLRVLDLALRPIRGGLRMVGRALTVDARADLMSVIEGLSRAQPGDVLVISAGSDERAVAGELFAGEAVRRGVRGIVIDGRCRDSRTLASIELPIYARGVAPHAFLARSMPVVGEPITIGGVEVHTGDLVLGDDDGIVVATEAELAAVIDQAETIQRRETLLRAAIEAGGSLFDSLNYDEHLAALRAGRPSALTFS